VRINTPWISHILFVDDCIVETSQRGADRLREILNIYGRGSSQLVNKDKSEIFFSTNRTDDMKEEVREGLHIETEAWAEKHLGQPTDLGRSTKEAFEYMPSRV
jgi:hypothetical protein